MTNVELKIKFDHEIINGMLNNIRELRDLYLMYCVDGTSPADDAEDMLTILRMYNKIDYHFLSIQKKMYNQENRQKGEPIDFPEVE